MPENKDIIFKDYVKREKIGVGGYGKVYLVTNDKDVSFALKVLHRDVELKRNEAEEVLGLHDVRLVKILDYGPTVDGDSCILMEYVPDNLENALDWGNISENKAIALFKEILLGLEAMETHSLLHRDIKPANLFLDSNVVKIGDFGSARITSGQSSSMSMDAAMTMHYCSPERFDSDTCYGFEVDRWAAAVIFCQMLTGIKPFAHNSDTLPPVMKAICMGEPDISTVPDRFKPFFEKAFQKEVSKRHSCVEDMREHFEKCCESESHYKALRQAAKAWQAALEFDWDKACALMEQAYAYDPEDDGLRKQLDKIREEKSKPREREPEYGPNLIKARKYYEEMKSIADVIVCPGDDFAKAMKGVRPNAVVAVEPGVYEVGDDVHISKPIQIVGSGPDVVVIDFEYSFDKFLLRSDFGSIVFSGMDCKGKIDSYCKEFHVKNCCVVTCSTRGKGKCVFESITVASYFYVKDFADPVVLNSSIKSEINITRGGQGLFKNNYISNELGYGVLVSGDGSAPVFENNRIINCEKCGVIVDDSACGSFTSNHIEGRRLAIGVAVKNSNPLFKCNKILSNAYGVIVCEKGKGVFKKNVNEKNSVGVLIKDNDSCPIFEDNHIAMNKEDGVVVQDGGAPVLVNNTIISNNDSGIYVFGQGKGLYQLNVIKGNKSSGIKVEDKGSKPTFENNRIENNEKFGVAMREESGGTFRKNRIVGSKTLSGVIVREGASPLLVENIISDNKQSGIFILEKGKGTYRDNVIKGNGLHGVDVIDKDSSPTFENNCIENNDEAGVVVRKEAGGTFRKNRIVGSKTLSGVIVREGSSPLLVENIISDNKQSGIFISEKGKGAYRDNVIKGNGIYGVEVNGKDSSPIFENNRIENNEKFGVAMREESGGTFRKNHIEGSKQFSGVLVKEGASPLMVDNVIAGNKQCGVAVFKGGKGRFKDNYIKNNAVDGLYIQDLNSDPTFENNSIHGNKQYAVRVNGQASGTFRNNAIIGSYPNYAVVVENGTDPYFYGNDVTGDVTGISSY